jgi:beta-lactamase superfamily II metal-dependent hydrolase
MWSSYDLRKYKMGYEIHFLPVGEGERSGDAIVLRFGNLGGPREQQTVVVIDAGFRESGERVVKHITGWYDTDRVDVAVSTHPDADHAAGLEVVIEKLKVDTLWMHLPWNHAANLAEAIQDGRVTDNSIRQHLRESLDTAYGLQKLAQRRKVPIVEPFAGVTNSTRELTVLGPTLTFYEGLLPQFRGVPVGRGQPTFLERVKEAAQDLVERVAERWDYETLTDDGETTPENESSVILLLEHDAGRMLFTGDAGIRALSDVADRLEGGGFDLSTLTFIQVPHHGSKRNVGPAILDRLVGPKRAYDAMLKTACVSCAKGGRPKHPAKKATNAFRRRGAHVFATEGMGTVHYKNTVINTAWTDATPLPFYDEVEE